ncbi:MAG: hypothetical protein HKN80_02300 [Acidimicrobiia bacterium]|nr:hypothetical protein [Acidimicrobiia bacterium]NNC91303.1 hypothetical protein [Acidimicrobiia bacterium]
MTVCAITDIQRIDFAEGADDSIDEHVMTCDECQDFLAELWHGQLQTDLSEPVMRVVGLEEFVIAVIKEGGGILARIGKALRVYGMGEESK